MTDRNGVGRKEISTHWEVGCAELHTHTHTQHSTFVHTHMHTHTCTHACTHTPYMCISHLYSCYYTNSQYLVPSQTWPYLAQLHTAAAASSSSCLWAVCVLVYTCVYMPVHTPMCSCKRVIRCPTLWLSTLEAESLSEVELCWQPANPHDSPVSIPYVVL